MKHVNTLRRQNAQLVKNFFRYTEFPVTSCRNLTIISLIPYPIKNVLSIWPRFATLTKLWGWLGISHYAPSRTFQ